MEAQTTTPSSPTNLGIQQGPMPPTNSPGNKKNLLPLFVICGATCFLVLLIVIVSTNRPQATTPKTNVSASLGAQSYKNPFSSATQTISPTPTYQNPFAQNTTEEVSNSQYQNPFAGSQ
jgi:hypothetical protein